MEAVTAAGFGHRLEDDGGPGGPGRRRSTGDAPALRHKVGDEWHDVSYSELGTAVSEIGRGLIDLGLEHGDKVSILAHTRPEWTYANLAILAAGTVSVSIYQTNSAEECHYVLQHSESKAVFVEDAEQLAKIREVQGDLPNLEHIVIFDPCGDIGDAHPARRPARARRRPRRRRARGAHGRR